MPRSFSQYFAALSAAFDRAAGGAPLVRFVCLAGRVLRLEFADPLLMAQLFAALEHREVAAPAEPADLTLRVWGSASSGVALPHPDSGFAAGVAARGERWGFNLREPDPDAIRGTYMPAPNEFFSAMDPVTRTAVYWRPDDRAVPTYVQGAPFIAVLEWWLRSRGLVLTHGAAVGTDQGGALIVGKGGRGKSTSAISCLFDQRMFYVADDYFILQPAPQPTAFSLFQSGKLAPSHLRQMFPGLGPMVVNPQPLGEDKSLFFPGRHFSDRMVERLPLKLALLPQVTPGRGTRLVRTGANRLLRGFASSTLYQSSSGGAETLRALTRTLAALPCYLLEIGSDTGAIADCIAEGVAAHV